MTETVATELRAHPCLVRTIIRAEVERDGDRQQGYLVNISLGGAFLAVEDPPATESALEIFLLLPWGGSASASSRRKQCGNRSMPRTNPLVRSCLSLASVMRLTKNYRATSTASSSYLPR